MGYILSNMSANLLGLGNAATPMGIKAMQELQKLNPTPTVATPAMCTLLALEYGEHYARSDDDDRDPDELRLRPSRGYRRSDLACDANLHRSGDLADQWYRKRNRDPLASDETHPASIRSTFPRQPSEPSAPLRRRLNRIDLDSIQMISTWTIPVLIAFIPLYASFRKVPVYESFIDGAKDGFQTAIGIIPHLVGMMTAISMFRASGRWMPSSD